MFWLSKESLSWAWWHTPITPALGRLRQEDLKVEASLGYIVSGKKKRGRRAKGI
jgi:hypothetical protein